MFASISARQPPQPQTSLTIDWQGVSPEVWESRFALLPRSNLLQSYPYARASCVLNRQRARWGTIQVDGQDAGLVQILEAGLLSNTIHAVILDRGPLWMEGFGSPEQVRAFFAEFNRLFPRRIGRKRRVLPEIPDTPEMKNLLVESGLTYVPDSHGYQTFWMDLRNSDDALLSGLTSKWRGKLRKSEKFGLSVTWTEDKASFAWLLKSYADDKARRGYDGPSVRFLSALSRAGARMLTGIASLEGRKVAGVLLVLHGTSATYQIGWSSPQGRDSAAHTCLLWKSLAELRERGILDFDLGGVNDEGAESVKTFKAGMGGAFVQLAGHYR